MGDRTVTMSISVEQASAENAQVCLRITDGHPAGEPVVLQEALIIGREQGVDLRLDAQGVSRRHAKVLRESAGKFVLIDLGSKNGTLLNLEPIDVAPLRPGDHITIGRVGLLFDRLHRVESRPAPSAKSVPSAYHLLSARELEIAQLVGKGLTNAEIGRQLGISRSTVATHLARAYERLDIHSRAALVQRLNSEQD